MSASLGGGWRALWQGVEQWFMLEVNRIPEPPMVQPITPRQLAILQMVAKHPGVDREQLARLAQASDEDMKYLLEHDLVREREAGKYRVAHFGEMVLRRS